MPTSRAQLIQQVALRMDEVSPNVTSVDLTVDGSDNNPLYTLIDGLVDGGVLELFSVAPYWRLPTKPLTTSDSTLSAKFGSRHIIKADVPKDFLRIAKVDCAEFQRPITELVPEMSDLGRRQHNRILFAKEAKPVGVMSHGSTGSEIHCYSTAAAATSKVATYIATPATIVDSGTAVTVETVLGSDPTLIPALEWLIAARTFGARGDANHAAICQQNAQNVLV